MPMDSIQINNFRGINESVDHTVISYEEASYARNCNTDNGVLTTPKSSSKFISDNFPYGIGTLMRYYKNNEERILIASGSRLYQLYKGVLTTIKTGLQSDKFDYTNVNYQSKDMIVLCNGIDDTFLYDGVEIRPLQNRGYIYNRDVDGNLTVRIIDENGLEITEDEAKNTRSPKGKFIELHYERLWISGNLAEPNRVYFSTANAYGFDIEDWTFPTEENEANQHGGFIDLPTYDGGQIIGLKTVFNDVVIFKTHTMHRIFGTYPGNYEVEQLFSSNGAISDRSIVATGNRVYFADEKGIYIYDGANVHKISDKIKNTWNTFTKEQLEKSVGAYKDNKYILSIPIDDNSIIIEFNENTGDFMICEDKSTTSFLTVNDGLIFENKGYIYKYKSNDSCDVDLVWISGLYDMNYPNARKRTEYIYFIGKGKGSVKITCITEKKNKEIIVPLTDIETPYKKKLKNKGRLVQFKIENVDNSQFVIKKPKIIIELDLD